MTGYFNRQANLPEKTGNIIIAGRIAWDSVVRIELNFEA